jgi:hypothetical protein
MRATGAIGGGARDQLRVIAEGRGGNRRRGGVVPAARFTDEWRDFADTAALIATLDLAISVDTSVAHLAGALGRPLWLLARFDACWRWLRGRDDSPWYPSARLFRQSIPGDWDGVIARIGSALRDRFGGGTD